MALPQYNQSGFYNPSADYSSGARAFGKGFNVEQQSPQLAGIYGTEQNPQGVFNARLAKLGLGGTGSHAKAAQGMYQQTQAGFKAAQAGSNMELFYPDYLDTVNLEKQMASQSWDAQGYNPGQYQGRYRWGARPI